METDTKTTPISNEPRDEFSVGATITVLTLLLGFIGSSFYVLVSSYLELI